jgi:hypothetical protein
MPNDRWILQVKVTNEYQMPKDRWILKNKVTNKY